VNRPRRVATIAHRYVGLGLALFLTIVGLTGAAIAWNDELERVFAPSMFVLSPQAAARPPLDPFELRNAAERAMPGYAVNGLDFTRRPDQPALFYVEARPGGKAPANDQIALDPSTGTIVGARRSGDLSQGLINLMPFLYSLHDSLTMGDTGVLILGVVALVWTIDCFVGAYLTFPARAATGRSWSRWFISWRKSWQVRRSSVFKLTFDLHRAGGLWLWGLLFILAWSSVSFNLPSVYNSVMRSLFGGQVDEPALGARKMADGPRLDWREAYATARAAMAKTAQREGFKVQSERLMFYDVGTHSYAYRVKTDRDPGRTGNTQISIDGDTGRIFGLRVPTGRNAGDTVTTWLGDLHTADVFGRAWQIVITIVGLGVAMLSITGVLVWNRKRIARASHRSTMSERKQQIQR
jgi:uncharacterized iron-regulated membrane protein